MKLRFTLCGLPLLIATAAIAAEQQTIGRFAMDRTEVTVGAFRAGKPADTAVVYIGFRCANDLKR